MKRFFVTIAVLAMLLSSCANDVQENYSIVESTSSSASETTEKTTAETALELIEDKKYSDAYALLYQNRDDAKAREMLSDFTVVSTKQSSKNYSKYNWFQENTYNEYGDIIVELNHSVYAGRNFNWDYTYDYTYDENGRALTCNRYKFGETEVNGSFEYTYDASGNLLKETCIMGEDVIYYYTYVYDENGNIIEEEYYNTEMNNYKKIFTYNAQNLLVKEIERKSDSTITNEYTLNNNGDIIKTDILSEYENGTEIRSTIEYSYEYDENGRKTKITTKNPDGTSETEEYVYNEQGDIVKETIVNAEGKIETVETTFVYSDSGEITKETIIKNAWSKISIQVKYDDRGNKTLETSGDAHNSYEYTYDEQGRISSKIVSYGEKKPVKYEYTYDINGNIIEEHSYNLENPDDVKIITYTYDSANNLLKEVLKVDSYINAVEYTYDEHNNMLSERSYDEDGDILTDNEYTYVYTENGKISEETFSAKNGSSYRNVYEYDEKGNCVKTTCYNASNAVSYTIECVYNDNGDLLERTYSYPDEDEKLPHCMIFTYDELGNLVSDFRQNEQLVNNNEAAYYEYSGFLYFYTPKN